MENKICRSIMVRPTLWKNLKEYAESQEKSMSTVIKEALDMYLNKKGYDPVNDKMVS